MSRFNSVRRWDKVQTFSVEVYPYKGVLFDAATDRELPPIVQSELWVMFPDGEKDDFPLVKLVLDYRAEGYHDPGSMYGGYDHMGSPPEGEDERTLEGVVSVKTDYPFKVVGKLSKGGSKALFDAYKKRVYEQDLDD